jgi:thymidylate synthase ThyX
MRTSLTVYYGADKQELVVYLDSENELNSNLLASIREHIGKSISLYHKALANGVEEECATMLLPSFPPVSFVCRTKDR